MKRHLAYLKYLLRHKWFVFVACFTCGVPLWRAIIHDWHKFLPSEWLAYAHTFYNRDGSRAKYAETPGFMQAWNFHQKRGKHHWQFWLLTWDRGGTVALDMPLTYVDEMLADWWGAGRAITGDWDAITWYEKNKSKMILSECTRMYVEASLGGMRYAFNTPEMIRQRIRILGC
jgi:hypothetical protein